MAQGPVSPTVIKVEDPKGSTVAFDLGGAAAAAAAMKPNVMTSTTGAPGLTAEDPSSPSANTLVHFTVGHKMETALVPKNAASDDIKDLFRSAAEAGPCDIVKLYTKGSESEGPPRLTNISAAIPPNTPTSPYRLEVVAVHCNGILMEQVGIDLLSLEKRVSALEKIVKNQSSPIGSIQELKEEVSVLRNKLENYEHLSWLGFYKALHPPPLPIPSKANSQNSSPDLSSPAVASGPTGIGYHKRSREGKKVICDKFLKLSDVILTRETCQLLREPTFDNWQWEDEEMLVLLQQMYLDLELPKKFDIEISILRNFLISVYHSYNDVPFHNFRHCFCVTQMMYGMACKVNLCERIGDLDTLILLTSCICHDLDHPGYNNIYQINAQTELALRYNDISPLENHHCSIAFRLLEEPECNIFRNLPTELYKKIREGMIRCILATDMARHNDIVNQFREIVPYFDATNRAHVNLLSMVLIKVADISNEARPMDIAERWLECLLSEFFQQSDTEKLEGLPVTPFMDRDKITRPSSQCSFIGLVLLPLFEVLGSLFTELEPLIVQPARYALDYYRKLNEASQATRVHRKSQDVNGLQAVAHNFPSPSPSPVSGPPTSNSMSVCDKIPSVGGAPDLTTTTTVGLSRQTRAHSISIPDNSSAGLGFGGTRHSSSSSTNQKARRSSHYHFPPTQTSTGSAGSTSSIKSGGRSSAAGVISFPSVESDSEREDSDVDNDELTEVAVSEKALKFKISTEASVDLTTSRKGSRENRSESSGQSSHTISALVPLKEDQLSYNTSTASTPKLEVYPPGAGAVAGSSSPRKPSRSPANSLCPPGTPPTKAKAKESFFTRLKLFTERLSMSIDSGSVGAASPPTPHKSFPSYFKRGRRNSKHDGSGAASGASSVGPASPATSSRKTKASNSKHHHHRGSNSDPEGRTEFGRRKSGAGAAGAGQSESERESELEEFSPARSVGGVGHKSSWKQCSGSLDSILSKEEEPKRSPGRRLMLPRFSSFVQRKTTKMGFMRKRTPKSTTQAEQEATTSTSSTPTKDQTMSPQKS